MNKKISISLLIIGLVVLISIGGTIAYFNDTEASNGNTFTAGNIDLKVNSNCTYNGQPVQECIWQETDSTNQLFFNYNDVKPGDWGENTISLHVYDNPAWVCAKFSNLKNYENGCNNPEVKSNDITCDNPGEGQGELQNYLNFTIWKDLNCNNIQDPEEQILANNQPASNDYWPIADKNHGVPVTDTCIGIKWIIPTSTGNIIQGDGLSGDISFFAVQSRNNVDFVCKTESFFDDFDDGNIDEWTTVIGNWRAEDNMLKQDLPGDNRISLLKNLSLSNQTIELMALFHDYAGNGGPVIWYQDFDNYTAIIIYPAGGPTARIRIKERIDGVSHIYNYSYPFINGAWYKIGINANSGTGKIELFIDNTYLFTHEVTTTNRTGSSGLISGNSGGYFDDFKLEFDN